MGTMWEGGEKIAPEIRINESNKWIWVLFECPNNSENLKPIVGDQQLP